MTKKIILDAHGTTWILEDAANVARFRMIREQLRYARNLDRTAAEARTRGLALAADILTDHARGVRTALRNGLNGAERPR
jgi:hypothetical protein